MIPINMQCWLNVGWGLTEFIIRIQGKWGSWVRSRCSLSQELKHTGVWETSHSLQWSQGPHLYVPLRIAAFLQFPHFRPPSPTFFIVLSSAKLFTKGCHSGFLLHFSALVCVKWKTRNLTVFLANERTHKINEKLAVRSQWEVLCVRSESCWIWHERRLLNFLRNYC